MIIINDLVQGSDDWRKYRLEKISGTRLDDALGTPVKQESLINELISEFLVGEGKENFASLAMALGSEAEDYAISEYEILTGEITEKIGICQSEEFPWLMNSPDRLIKKDGKYKKAVEVKSPNPETAIKYIRKGEIPNEYYSQVMSYFLVNEDLQELDFVVYSPKIQTEQYRLWIKNVKREDLPLKEAKEKLIKFYDKWQQALRKLNLEI